MNKESGNFPDVSDSETKRKNIQVDLTPTAREIIDGLREDTGVPNTAAMERLLEWFAALDRRLRVAILTRDRETVARLLPSVVGRMIGAPSDISAKPIGEMSVSELGQVLQAVTEELLVRAKGWEHESRAVVASRLKKSR